ncbi:Alkylglycerol monooxygenase [Lamellibrachia satsuma]|nr:Alkylglycerol monooxygenase [Lamellibrachia satsuma]
MASTNVSTLLSPGQYEVAKDLVRLFYVVSPTETSFEHVEDVPDFVNKTIPYFLALIVLECVVQYLQGKPTTRANDGFSSLSAGLLHLLPL